MVLSAALAGACAPADAPVDGGAAPSDSDARVVEGDSGPTVVSRDAGVADDAASASPSDCTNGRLDDGEVGVDCGGDCPPCTPGGACAVGADCASGRCDEGRCAEATCSDGLMNGTETSVDCGGGGCIPCSAGAGCSRDADCASALCDRASSTCLAPGCHDGVRNGDESDVDCGGACPGCPDGAPCGLDADCRSAFCDVADTCAAPRCDDGVRNGDELGIDCGGGVCPGCGDGEVCLAGSDCGSGVCDATLRACAVPTCTDGVRNSDETDIDCGGATCPSCGSGSSCAGAVDCLSGVCAPGSSRCAAPSCTDGVRNGDETGVDCGGGTCPGCGDGGACGVRTDCVSRVCILPLGICDSATCADGVRNGSETAIDCGGDICPACDVGGRCSADDDCTSGVCGGRVCLGPSCTDGVANGDEHGVDCGGSCPGCGEGSPCSVAEDCSSGVCDPMSESCAAPSCTDGIRNGEETDVDCGGPVCLPCEVGEDCASAGDCRSMICSVVSSTCGAPSCGDGVQNGDETDVDCGGSCPACGVGDRCLSAGDCAESYCRSRVCRQYASCNDMLQAGVVTRSGIYRIHPTATTSLLVYCDMTTDGGGWTRVAYLSAGSRSVSTVYRGSDFFTQAWVQGDTNYTITDNAHVNLWGATRGMLDARPLVGFATEIRFSCSDETRGTTVDVLWTPGHEDFLAFLRSELGGAGYASTNERVRIQHDSGAFVSARAFPTSARAAYWDNSHICGSGAGGGAPTAGSSGGFQLGLCHNGPTASDIGVVNAHQVAIGYSTGSPTLRLECGADTPSDGSPIDGTWMAWVR